MIKNMRHAGLVVRDLDISLVFYQELLGLSVFKRMKEKGHYIERVVGITGASLEWVKLQAADGSLLELIQYNSTTDTPQKVKNAPSDQLGCSHVAFTVKNLDLLHKTLVDKGYNCNSEPQMSPDGMVKVMYCHDPDGIILELVEELQ
jgi:catechol 2,3-dioxygenase-like lactoylglutathione lyase family enzyme